MQWQNKKHQANQKRRAKKIDNPQSQHPQKTARNTEVITTHTQIHTHPQEVAWLLEILILVQKGQGWDIYWG